MSCSRVRGVAEGIGWGGGGGGVERRHSRLDSLPVPIIICSFYSPT